MASTKTSEMEIFEQLKDLTECCVCSETFKDPKSLPCLHTFCMKCLEAVGGNAGKGLGDQLPCPVCRKEFTIPEEGYTALQKNFLVGKLIDMAKIASPSEGPDLCEACMEGESVSTSTSEVRLADMYCADCQRKLCQECSRYHLKKKLTRNHQLVAVADFKHKVQTIAQSNCIKHKMELDLYCSDCKKLLCKLCFGEGHQNHRLQSTINVVEGFKNEIKTIVSGLEVCESKVLEKKLLLNCKVEEYCKNLEGLKLEVSAQIDAAVKLISEHASLIMQDIDQLNVQKRKEVEAEIDDDLACLEAFKVYCAQLVTKGSASDICCTIDELKARFEVFKNVQESDLEVKACFRKISLQTSNLEEFVKTAAAAGYSIIGTIHECRTEVEGEDETETASDKVSRVGDINMNDNCRRPISGNNSNLANVNHLKQELERRRIRGLELKKAFEKRINELELELSIKRPRKSTSELPIAQVAQPLSKQEPPARIAIDYKQSPNLVKTLRLPEGDRSLNRERIFGFTVMDDELFVGCFAGRAVVEVYDIETFNFKRRWQVKSESSTGLVRICCMMSCTRHKCLYACLSFRGSSVECLHVIQRTDVNGLNAKELKVKGGMFVPNLSVTGEGNIIVITDKNSLIEYSGDGVLVNEVKLSSSLFIEHPLHALKLANGNFVVSHGLCKDRLHRVLMLSESGQMTKSFGEMSVSGVRFSEVEQVPEVYEPKLLNQPVYLTEDGFGNILLADCGNNRIVVLNSNLELESSINPTRPLHQPTFMCVDADRRQLFVCEALKKISVFDFSF